MVFSSCCSYSNASTTGCDAFRLLPSRNELLYVISCHTVSSSPSAARKNSLFGFKKYNSKKKTTHQPCWLQCLKCCQEKLSRSFPSALSPVVCPRNDRCYSFNHSRRLLSPPLMCFFNHMLSPRACAQMSTCWR